MQFEFETMRFDLCGFDPEADSKPRRTTSIPPSRVLRYTHLKHACMFSHPNSHPCLACFRMLCTCMYIFPAALFWLRSQTCCESIRSIASLLRHCASDGSEVAGNTSRRKQRAFDALGFMCTGAFDEHTRMQQSMFELAVI